LFLNFPVVYIFPLYFDIEIENIMLCVFFEMCVIEYGCPTSLYSEVFHRETLLYDKLFIMLIEISIILGLSVYVIVFSYSFGIPTGI